MKKNKPIESSVDQVVGKLQINHFQETALKYLELRKPTNQSRAGIKAILIHQHQTRQTEINVDNKIEF